MIFSNAKAGGEMPTSRSRLTRAEYQQYRTRLLRFERMGIPIGRTGDPSHEPTRLTLEQIDYEFAAFFELPGGQVAVVVPARMMVLIPGIMITDLEMTTPWDGPSLDLSDPEGEPFYQEVICGLPSFPPTILNHMLKRQRPLPRCQEEGVIIANGWSPVPPNCNDKTPPVTVKLFLRDERGNKLSFDFGARVDRSVNRKYERQQRERHKGARSTKRVSLFEREDIQLGDPKSVAPEEAIKHLQAGGEHDSTCDARTPETQIGGR